MHDLLILLRAELRGAWRYRWIAMIVAWAICLGGWIFVYTMPNIYEARAQVYVDADSRLAAVMSQVGVSPGVNSRVFVVRQAMTGRPQLERVARETDLDLRARTEQEKEALLLNLGEKVNVSSGRAAQARNLYTITYERPEPGHGRRGRAGTAEYIRRGCVEAESSGRGRRVHIPGRPAQLLRRPVVGSGDSPRQFQKGVCRAAAGREWRHLRTIAAGNGPAETRTGRSANPDRPPVGVTAATRRRVTVSCRGE